MMKVLAVAGSPRTGETTEQLVKEVLTGVECETEFISLSGKEIRPCTACLGCVEDNVCVIQDDMQELRAKIVDADAYIIGAPNYYGMLNGQTHCFLERWYQFRHREGKAVSGKLGVAVGVGGGEPEPPAEDIERFFEYNQIDCVGSVTARGRACCFSCGYGETCKVGAIHMFYGPDTEITEEITPDLSRQPEKIDRARELGRQLSDRLADYARAT